MPAQTESEFPHRVPPTPQAAADDCNAPLPPLVIEGIELFNEGKFFEAHEALETAWRAEMGPVRELYRGILQIAVSYYHLQRGNYSGAVKMLDRSRYWLQPYPDLCRSVDVSALREDSQRVEDELLRLGPQEFQSINRALLQPVKFIEHKGKQDE